MMTKQPFTIVYAPIVKQHLRVIEAKYYSLIRDGIEAQLQFEPDIETRNRKPLKRPVAGEAGWELRLGPKNRFRVFYEVDREGRVVEILGIGEKRGEQVLMGKKGVIG